MRVFSSGSSIFISLISVSSVQSQGEPQAQHLDRRRTEAEPQCVHGVPKQFAQATLDAARQTIGLERSSLRSDPVGLLTQTKNWYSFWHHVPAECAVGGTKGFCAVYVPVVNVGVHAIRDALLDGLFAVADTVERTYITISQASCLSDEYAVVHRLHVPDLQETCFEKIFVFTFVQEPLLHFVSGYQKFIELEYGADIKKPADVAAKRRDILLDQNDASRLAEKMVTGEMHWPNPNAANMALMSGTFRNWYGNFDFVGRIDNINEDWLKIIRAARVTTEELVHLLPPPEVAKFGTTKDPFNARTDMIELLTKNNTLRMALCHLLTPDYRCFGFDLQACINGSVLQ